MQPPASDWRESLQAIANMDVTERQQPLGSGLYMLSAPAARHV
jgi:hypothetical protein